MANITETNGWPAGVYQYEDGDVLDGGPDSSEVLPIKQLANRSVFQRLANVTPWDDVLAGLHGYPAGACVMHAGKSWRSKAANNNTEPGTDVLKWERWAYSDSELQEHLRSALLSPTRCPASGPETAPSAASPWTIWKSVEPLAEVWMWMGDQWRVVANAYHTRLNSASIVAYPAGITTILTYTAHRAGNLHVSMNANGNSVAGGHYMAARIVINGVMTGLQSVNFAIADQPLGVSAAVAVKVAPNDEIVLSLHSDKPVSMWPHAELTYTS